MTNHSSIKDRINNAKKGKGEFTPLIPEGEKEAIHTLRFVSGKVERSKKNNKMAVLKCQLKKRGDKKLNDKEENLYFLLKPGTSDWQTDHLLAIVSGLGVDLNRIGRCLSQQISG